MAITTITGTVTGKSIKNNSIELGGTWYKSWDSGSLDDVHKGDEVSFNAADKVSPRDGRVFWNIKGEVKVTNSNYSGGGSTGGGKSRDYRGAGMPGGFPLAVSAYERALDRRNALQCAVEMMDVVGLRGVVESEEMGPADVARQVIDIAKLFENYSAGDELREELEQRQAEDTATH